MSVTIAQLVSIATETLSLVADENRYTDQAIQFVEYAKDGDGDAKATGRISKVYGGVWDTIGNRFAPERKPKRVVRYRVSRKQYGVLEVAASGRVHHILVKGARRSSKSELLALWVILRGLLLPGKRISLTFTKFAKAKEWLLEKLLPRIRPLISSGRSGYRKSPDDFGVTLRCGSRVSFITAEVVDAPRGSGVASAGCDERQIIDKEVVDNQMLCLSEGGDDYQTFENGTALQGEFQDYYEAVIEDEDYLVEEMTSFDNPFIGRRFLEDAKKHMDPRRYAQEVLAEFAPQAALVYHQFEKHTHVHPVASARAVLAGRYGVYRDCGRDITEAVTRHWFHDPYEWIVGMDFNVSPMCAVIYKLFAAPPGVPDIWWGVDELVLEDRADATRMAIALKRAGYYPAVIIPDASGSRSEGGRSSHRMLRDEGYQVFATKKNPDIPDRINAVNAKLLNARSQVTLFFDPRCKSVIKCLGNHKTGTDGKPEKDKVYEHRGDALGYPIAYMCPAAIDYTKADGRTPRIVNA